MNPQTINSHYSDPEFIDFYKKVFDGNGFNIGLYMSNIDANENNLSYLDIQKSLDKKWELIFFFIRNYLNIQYNFLAVVDFGGGIGDTMRKLYESITDFRRAYDNKSEYLLYSYDISRENTSQCNHINFEEKIPVRIYNRNFLETLFSDNSVNLVISQETFHQVSDKLSLVREISRILARVNGFLIFSDIFLREDCDEDTREKVMEELSISTIQKFSEFQELAEQNGLMYCNSILYSHDLKFHYTNLLEMANINEFSDKIKTYLKSWCNVCDYLDLGLFVFKKL